MSGTPVAAPVLSLHVARLDGSSTKRALEPTVASAFWQASIVPLVVSSGVNLESHVRTLTCRQARPPLAFTVLAHACSPSIEPWKRPGARGDPTSAMTSTVRFLASTPTSLAVSASVPHFPAAAVVAVSPAVAGGATAAVVAVLLAAVVAVELAV